MQFSLEINDTALHLCVCVCVRSRACVCVCVLLFVSPLLSVHNWLEHWKPVYCNFNLKFCCLTTIFFFSSFLSFYKIYSLPAVTYYILNSFFLVLWEFLTLTDSLPLEFEWQYYYHYDTACKFFTLALADEFQWSLSDRKIPQASRTLFPILSDLNNVVVWTVSISFRISKSLMTFQSAPVIIGITVTFMFHSVFSSLTRSHFCFCCFCFFSFSLGGPPGR